MLSGQGQGEQYRGQRGQGEQGLAVWAGQPGDSPVQGQHQGPGQQEEQEEAGIAGAEEAGGARGRCPGGGQATLGPTHWCLYYSCRRLYNS